MRVNYNGSSACVHVKGGRLVNCVGGMVGWHCFYVNDVGMMQNVCYCWLRCTLRYCCWNNVI